MVLLHVKKGEEFLFLYSCQVTDPVESVLGKVWSVWWCGTRLLILFLLQVVSIYNGRRKVLRLAEEIKDLAKHGVVMKAELQGLHPDQVKELKLVDEYEEQCQPSGGFAYEADPVQRRNGRAPVRDLKNVLTKAADEAKEKVHKDNVKAGVEVGEKTVRDSLDLMSGAVTIVWPMGLPHHDPVRMELENCEDLTGTQESKMVIDPQRANMWFANKEMMR